MRPDLQRKAAKERKAQRNVRQENLAWRKRNAEIRAELDRIDKEIAQRTGVNDGDVRAWPHHD